MKIYRDSSTEILQRSNHYRVIKRIKTFTKDATLVLLIIGIIVVLIATTRGYAFDSTFLIIVLTHLLVINEFTDSESAGDSHCKIDIDSTKLCLITNDFEETLSIIPGEQTIFLDNFNYEYRLCSVEQTLKITFLYEYQPSQHSPTKERQALADPTYFNTELSKARYQAHFRLKFAISPQALTDEGRHALMLDLKRERALKASLTSWITTGFIIDDESGNLEIAQQFLDNNPYGFRQMSVKLIEISRLTSYGLKIV